MQGWCSSFGRLRICRVLLNWYSLIKRSKHAFYVKISHCNYRTHQKTELCWFLTISCSDDDHTQPLHLALSRQVNPLHGQVSALAWVCIMFVWNPMRKIRQTSCTSRNEVALEELNYNSQQVCWCRGCYEPIYFDGQIFSPLQCSEKGCSTLY